MNKKLATLFLAFTLIAAIGQPVTLGRNDQFDEYHNASLGATAVDREYTGGKRSYSILVMNDGGANSAWIKFEVCGTGLAACPSGLTSATAQAFEIKPGEKITFEGNYSSYSIVSVAGTTSVRVWSELLGELS